jgi:hypothetical protein
VTDKCSATLGGNPCKSDADFDIEDEQSGEEYKACERHVGAVLSTFCVAEARVTLCGPTSDTE